MVYSKGLGYRFSILHKAPDKKGLTEPFLDVVEVLCDNVLEGRKCAVSLFQ